MMHDHDSYIPGCYRCELSLDEDHGGIVSILAKNLSQKDIIKLDGVFYTVLDKRPPTETHSRFQLRTLAGTTVQVDIEHETRIELVK